MTTNNHPANGPVSLDRLHQISETLSKAAAQSEGGNLGYAMADAVKVIDWAIAARKVEAIAEIPPSRFLPECLKPEEISGKERAHRIVELMRWFDRYYNGKANPKWFKSHTAELCYYILSATPSPIVPEEMTACKAYDLLIEKGGVMSPVDSFVYAWNHCRAAMLQAGNSPVTQDGYVLVPKKLTAENGAKSVLSGEFSETKFINCPECFGDDDCETCDGSGRIEITVPVTWTTIKAIWAKGVEHFAAAPQQENV
ncbi:hypothetical protein FP371_22355 [Citrobacter freundii]|uniref:hypothetical protein n=1 Tax=Citrobacter freundii TaxID=546 RepID=UPI001BCC3F66|nr:hypothetical protein [Citrobacter freundii]MBY5300958.1 hypothetical protein [Citrobacter freundii]